MDIKNKYLYDLNYTTDKNDSPPPSNSVAEKRKYAK